MKTFNIGRLLGKREWQGTKLLILRLFFFYFLPQNLQVLADTLILFMCYMLFKIGINMNIFLVFNVIFLLK